MVFVVLEETGMYSDYECEPIEHHETEESANRSIEIHTLENRIKKIIKPCGYLF